MKRSSPELVVVALVTAAVVTALALEAVYEGAAFYAAAAWLVIVPVVLRPRIAVPALLAYLCIQEPLAAHVGEISKQAQGALRSFDEMAIIAAVIRILLLHRRRELSWLSWKDWRWAAAAMFLGVASSALHGDAIAPAAAGLFLSCRFFAYVMLVWSVDWEEHDATQLVRVVTWLGPILLLIGFLGSLAPEITERLIPNSIGEEEFARSGLRSFRAPFLNPGIYGWACGMAAMAAIAAWLVTRRRSNVPAMLGSLVGVVLSLRRKPLIGIPVALLASAAHLNRRQRLYLAASVTAVVIAGAYWGGDQIRAVLDDTAANYLDSGSRDETARGALTSLALVLAQDLAPLGAGLGRFGSYPSVLWYSPLYDQMGISHVWGFSPDAPHYLLDVYWPHLLGELGFLGTGFMVLWFWRLWRRLRDAAQALTASLVLHQVALFGTMVLAEALVESVAMPVFETPLPALAVALPVGMALRLAGTPRNSAAPANELAVP
jgi:hypothetical protein